MKKAEWVADGTWYTAVGAAAGADMVAGFVLDAHGPLLAGKVQEAVRYRWGYSQGR